MGPVESVYDQTPLGFTWSLQSAARSKWSSESFFEQVLPRPVPPFTARVTVHSRAPEDRSILRVVVALEGSSKTPSGQLVVHSKAKGPPPPKSGEPLPSSSMVAKGPWQGMLLSRIRQDVPT